MIQAGAIFSQPRSWLQLILAGQFEGGKFTEREGGAGVRKEKGLEKTAKTGEKGQ